MLELMGTTASMLVISMIIFVYSNVFSHCLFVGECVPRLQSQQRMWHPIVHKKIVTMNVVRNEIIISQSGELITPKFVTN